MKRSTICMSDADYSTISMYSKSFNISFSKACTILALRGITSKSSCELSEKLMDDLDENNVGYFVQGNFSIPRSVMKRAIESSFDEVVENEPLVEFRQIVGA